MPSDSILVPPGIANHTYQNPFEYHVYWGAVTDELGLFQKIEALRLLGFKDNQIALSINAQRPDGDSTFINKYFQLNNAGKMDKWQVLERLKSKFPPRAGSYPPSPTNTQLQAQLAAPRKSVSVRVVRRFSPNPEGGSPQSPRGATVLAFRSPDGTVPQSSSEPGGQPSSAPSSTEGSTSSQSSPGSAASSSGNSASSQSSSGRSIPFYRDTPPSHSENGWVTDAGRLDCAKEAFKRVFFSREDDLKQIPGYSTAESPAAKEEALFAEATRRGQGARFESAREGLLSSLRRADPSRLSYLPRGLADWCRQSRPARYLALLRRQASIAGDPTQIARYSGGTAAALGGFGVLVGVTQFGIAIDEMLSAEENSSPYSSGSPQFNSAAADAVRAGGRTVVSVGVIVRGIRIIKAAVGEALSAGGAMVAAPVLAVTEVAAGIIEGKGKQGPEKAVHVRGIARDAAVGYLAGATWAPAGAVGGAKLGALIGTAVGTVVGGLIGSGAAFLAGTALGNAAMAYSGRGKTDEQVNKSMPLARFINWAIG